MFQNNQEYRLNTRNTGLLARPFTCLLALLTRLLAPHYSLHSARFARAFCCAYSFARLLTLLTPELMGQ